MPTATNLLSPATREQENSALATMVAASNLAALPLRISETNTTASCDASGGPQTSPVFASALWAQDWALRAIRAGATGVNFHGYFGRCAPDTFSPICAPGRSAETLGRVIARPEYYGLLAASQLAGGHFVPAVLADGQDGEGTITAYATVHPDHGLTVAILNFASRGATGLIVRVPGYSRAQMAVLTAPTLTSTSRVTFGHPRLTPSGRLAITRSAVPGTDGTFKIIAEPHSATVLWLR